MKNYLENTQVGIQDSYFKSNIIQKIIKNNKIKFKNFCEVGCGVGKIIENISLNYKKKSFFGYEISKTAYKLCNKKLKNVKYFNKSIEGINKKFDIILCADVLEHVENPYLFLRNIKKNQNFKFSRSLDLLLIHCVNRYC